MIPMVDLGPALHDCQDRIQANLNSMHGCGQYITGPQLARFEREFAAATGAEDVVGCGTGTAAIELCLREAGIVHKRQQVIVPALTSLFTPQAVLAAGATPVIVDVDEECLLLDLDAVKRAWTPQTAAVICVHLYGQPGPLAALQQLCAERGAVLIQDACQAHLATSTGRPLTDFSPYVAYSFYPTKNLGALGDGGAVATRSNRIARRLRMLRDGGRRQDQMARAAAINSRLDELHCCYLRAFLPELVRWTEHRIRIGRLYHERLCTCPDIRLIPYPTGSVFHLYVIRVPANRRNALQAHLRAAGVQTRVHYPFALHQQPAFRRNCLRTTPLPHAERAVDEVVSLPIGPHVSLDDANRVASLALEFFAAW